MTPLLLGPAPGRRGGRAFAPAPGSAGMHLARLLGVPDVAELFPVANLLSDWPGPAAFGVGDDLNAAALRAAGIAFDPDRWPRIIMVGRAVARVLSAPPTTPYLTWFPLTDRTEAALLPHPSGINRWWNDPDNRTRAAVFLLAAANGTGPTN